MTGHKRRIGETVEQYAERRRLDFTSTRARPKGEVRKPVFIYLLPSLKDAIDARRGKITRSVWIHAAIEEKLNRENES